MATMDIKQMLQNGSSPEDLKAALDRQITQAMGEIREEQKAAAIAEAKNIEIEETRENVIDALLDYLTALGVFDNDEDNIDLDEIAEDLNDEFKKAEKTILATFNMLKDFDWFLKDKDKKTEKKVKDSCSSECSSSTKSTKPVQTVEKVYTADADAILRSFLNKI